MKNSKEIELKNKNPYNIWNLALYPLIFILVIGSYEVGQSSFLNDKNTIGLLAVDISVRGLFYLVLAYYPVKIFFLLLNRFTKGKWEWPYSILYFILPLILFFGKMYIDSTYNNLIQNL